MPDRSQGLVALAAIVALALTATQASAQTAPDTPPNGAAQGMRLAAPAEDAVMRLGRIRATQQWNNAAVASAGVGLRNRAGGAIELGDVLLPVRRAFIYWTLITAGEPPAGAQSIGVQRVHPTRSVQRVFGGVPIATGPSPCWGGDRITVYRANLPLFMVTGNGTYVISVPHGVAGRTDGASPSDGSWLPAYNGASIVAIGTGNESVALYEAPLSGSTIEGGRLAYTLILPPRLASSTWPVRFHQIGSDGQEGFGGGVPEAGLSQDTVRVNGTLISGRGSIVNDSDWNGSAGGSIAQLWDDRLRQFPAGVLQDNRMRVLIDAGSDCITPVANIVTRANPFAVTAD